MSDTKLDVKQGESASQPPPLQGRRHPFASLRQEIDRLFDDMAWPSFDTMRSRGGLDPFRDFLGGFTNKPAVDLVERDTGYELEADLPGMSADDIEVSLSEGVLTIRGEKSDTREEKDKGYHLRERNFGSFSRALALPPGIDADHIEAKFDKGVLKISIPKSEKAKAEARKIAVQAA